jgi:DNA/RNA-binding domain of Phe-tRNA-synthetase-like protein
MQKQLDAINPAVDQAQFASLEQVMVNQEQDFQAFLGSVKLAVSGLSEMMSGSRGWREDFYSKLDAAIATSKQRELDFTGPEEMAANALASAAESPEQ